MELLFWFEAFLRLQIHLDTSFSSVNLIRSGKIISTNYYISLFTFYYNEMTYAKIN